MQPTVYARRLLYRFLVSFAAIAFLPTSVFSQVIVFPVPRPRAKPVFEAFELQGRVRDQVARITARITLGNEGQAPAEAILLLPLPRNATLHGVTLLADGQELTGELLLKEEATRSYESIVRRYKDPALVEYVDCDLYRARVFPIPPGKSRQLDLSITFACPAQGDTVQLVLPTPRRTTQSLVPQAVRVRLTVTDRRPIRSFFTTTSGLTADLEDPHRGVVYGKLTSPEGTVRVYYRTGGQRITAWALSTWPSEESYGYFMLFLTPPARGDYEPYQPKDILLVIDCSGSMNGEKIQQARQAVTYVLQRLRPEDRFNLIAYADDVEPFRDGLVPATKENIRRGVEAARELEALGGTNIHDALVTALQMCRSESGSRPTYILFLTDGRPTAGKRSRSAIEKAVRENNRCGARVICFGVGHDVNSKLLDRVARISRGTTIYVPPGEDLERSVSTLYRTIAAPALTNVRIELTGVRVKYVYPKETPDLFIGTQATVVGRYRGEGSEVSVAVTGTYRGEEQRYNTTVRLVRRGEGLADAYVARVWAGRRIAYLLDLVEQRGDDADEELVNEIIRLARKFNIVTPYTSFLAEEQLDAPPPVPLLRRQLGALTHAEAGAAAYRARQAKSQLRTPTVGLAASADILARRLAPAASMGQDEANGRTPRRLYLGGRTFVYRPYGWCELGLDADDLEKARTVVLFSDSFFQVVHQIPPEVRRIFAFQPPIYLRVGKAVYKFVSAE